MKQIINPIHFLVIVSFVFFGTFANAQNAAPTITHLYAHIDKELYSPDEFIWFKIYAYNGLSLDTNLQNINVDFYSPDKKLIDHQIYLSYLSSAYGFFKIPKNYPYSILTMVVYKNQLNTSQPYYFQKEVYVLNSSAKKWSPTNDTNRMASVKNTNINNSKIAVTKEAGFVSVNVDNSDFQIKGLAFQILSATDTIFNNHYVLSSKKKLALKIPSNLLEDGFYQFIITNEDNQTLFNQYIFNNTYKYLATPTLNLDTLSVESGGINVWNIKSLPLANVSVSVIDADIPSSNSNIASELLFNSFINQKISNLSSYFTDTSLSTIQQFDAFIQNQNILPHYAPLFDTKNSYLSINGKVLVKKGIFKKTQLPPFVNVVIGAPNKKINLYQALVKPDSSFSVSNLLFFDTVYARGVLNGSHYFKEDYEVTIDTSFTNQIKDLKINNSLPAYYFDHMIGSKVNKIKTESLQLDSLLKLTTLKDAVVKSDPTYKLNKLDAMYASGLFDGGNAYRLNVEDDPFFEGTFDLGNYITASVPGITYDPNYFSKDAAGGFSSFNPGDEAYKSPFTWRGQKTSIYLDEVKVDYDFVRDLPKTSIGYIKVFRPIFFGEPFGGGGGAVSIYTKKFSDKSESYSHNTENTMIKGYHTSKSLEDITDENEYIFKNSGTTLYWNPMVITSKNGDTPFEIRFKNNHFTKAYKLRIEGVDVNGQLLFFEKVIHP